MKVILGERFFTLEEVGKMLGVSRESVSKYIREREVETSTIQRRKYVTEDGVKKLLLPR